MRTLFASICLFVAMGAQSAGVTLDAEIAAPILQFMDSFNKGDANGAEAAHMKQGVVIIDEVPPHQWQGDGAFAAWLRDLTKHDEAGGVTDGNVKLGDAIRQVVSGDHAYVVMAAEYTFKRKGVPMKAVAQMTFALVKGAGGWRISGWTYSGAEGVPVKP